MTFLPLLKYVLAFIAFFWLGGRFGRYNRRCARENLYWAETIGANHPLMNKRGYERTFACFNREQLLDDKCRKDRLEKIKLYAKGEIR